ncbi:hypothetical protein MMC30_008525 [Trapelia coarctata]|nr:hypothetical protein [Trapelia coarctata]
MAPALPPDTAVMQELLRTHAHELSYERSVFQSKLVCIEEVARRLRVQILLSEDERDDLHAQLLQSDYRIEELECWLEDTQNSVQIFEGEAEQLRNELRLKNREVENLKAELHSLQGVSMDSTKLLTEKLSLSRELAALRPEVEHLRTQAASCQTLLAEKLSLQRQLSGAQVELENEKRATQRALIREEGKQEQDAKLEAQIDNLQAELAKERRERQKAERESQKVVAEFDGKKTILESRLDAFRNKLRLTKEQLKETQDELQTTRANARTQSTLAATTAVEIARNPRKRSIAQLDTDATIGTPGLIPAAKRNKRGSTLPGDKSTFSITPFLNRTTSIAPESPDDVQPSIEKGDEVSGAEDENEDKDEQNDHADATADSPSAKPTKKATKKVNKPTTVPTKKSDGSALTTAKAGKVNAKPAPARKSAKIAPVLAQVEEEPNDENRGPAIATESGPSDLPASKPAMRVFEAGNRASEEPTFIKKKRKLLGGGLGKTLFDDEDGEAGKGGFGGARAFGTLGRGVGGVNFGARNGLGGAGGFGAFSPLKRDRKVGAA